MYSTIFIKRLRKRGANEISTLPQIYIFEKEITATITVIEKKKEYKNAARIGKLSNFVVKLYPVAKLSLESTSVIARVRFEPAQLT